MRYVILGTAGHIDHGKSSLVKALTGIDPDRLKEEKERGITIDLGFAYLKYPDGLSIGIVDVPGHEKLIKNMLAGAGGIDIVLFVIAADEGVMPQSREHLHICNLLGIKSGIIAITKADLVDPEWLELVSDEIKNFVKGTFLEGAEVIPISSKTGMNIEVLKEKIKETALRVEPKPSGGLFRMPIDRVFTLKGFGTVVTGTIISGSISLEDPVEVLPAGITSKVRGLHSHGSPIKRAYAGQRTAINLQGVEKEQIGRGETLVTPQRFLPTRFIDANLVLLKDVPPLKNRSLVHFHTGTFEGIARCILYDIEELRPGESAFCQMRLEEPVIVQSGDRYIVRRFSPVETIGGGVVLDPMPSKRKKTEPIHDLLVYDRGTLSEKIETKIKKVGIRGMTKDSIEGWIFADRDEIKRAIKEIKESGNVFETEGLLIHKDTLFMIKEKMLALLREFHKKNPLKPGISKEELRNTLRLDQKVFSGVISLISEIKIEKDIMRLRDFASAPSEEDIARILSLLKNGGFSPPMRSELAAKLQIEENRLSDILRYMAREGSLVRINDSIYVSKAIFEEMMRLLREFYKKKPEMTVAEFRDLLGTSRKYAVPFLEYLDSNGITIRVGDIRKFRGNI